jgi:hypothetical protein
VDGLVYLGNLDGQVLVVRLGGQGGVELVLVGKLVGLV